MKWNSAVVAEHLTSNVLANRGGTVELQEHVGLQQILGTCNFAIGDHGTQTHPFALYVEQHFFAFQWITDPVDAPQSCVLVASVE